MKVALALLLMAGSAFAQSHGSRARLSSGGSAIATSCTSCVLLTTDQTVAGVKTFSSALTSSVASGSVAVQILSGSKLCLETGGLSCFSSDATTMTATKKFNSADDMSTGGKFTASQQVIATTGFYIGSNAMMPTTAATVSSGFCSSPAIVSGSKGFAGKVTLGTSCAAGTGVLGLPATNTCWVCTVRNITSPAGNVVAQTACSSTSATFANYSRTLGTALNWTDSEVLLYDCTGY